MGDVVQIGEFRFRQAQEYGWTDPKACQHRKLILDDDGHHVKCEDCKTQLSAYWVLKRLLRGYYDMVAQIKRERKELEELRNTNIVLVAAKKAQEAWRSKTTIPTCPHCHRGIFPTDNFGGDICSKKYELQQREEKIGDRESTI